MPLLLRALSTIAIQLKLSPNTRARLKIWQSALYKHYTAPQDLQFKSLRNGFVLFAFGLATVLITNASLPASVTQELVILLGLIVGGIGFLWAMKAYIRIVISRLLIFFTKK